MPSMEEVRQVYRNIVANPSHSHFRYIIANMLEERGEDLISSAIRTMCDCNYNAVWWKKLEHSVNEKRDAILKLFHKDEFASIIPELPWLLNCILQNNQIDKWGVVKGFVGAMRFVTLDRLFHLLPLLRMLFPLEFVSICGYRPFCHSGKWYWRFRWDGNREGHETQFGFSPLRYEVVPCNDNLWNYMCQYAGLAKRHDCGEELEFDSQYIAEMCFSHALIHIYGG